MNRPLTTGTDRRDAVSSVAAEGLSALVDGELSATEWASLWRDGADGQAQVQAQVQAFARYEWIGQVLRQGEAAPGPADTQRVAAIMARLREGAAAQVPATPARPVAAEPMPAAPMAPERAAANDEVFRWKLLAGFAALAAAASVVWNVSQVPSGAAAPQLAQAPVAAPVAAVQADANAPAVLAQTEPGPMLRDPRLEELMAAHRQAGGMSALQMPAGFLRNATFELPGGDR